MPTWFKVTKAALLAAVLMSSAAKAEETVVWWDFLSGGDGVRMKQLITDFNAAHQGKIKIDATTLEWGTPFYSKVQTSAAVGEAPDVMTYHASRIPLAVKQGILQRSPGRLGGDGLKQGDYAASTWNAVTVDDKQYAVPLDTHPIVLYYNKDLLSKAGVLDANGKPKGLDSRQAFEATLKALKDSGVKYPLGSVTADGNFMFRTVYSLMGQQDGELMTATSSWPATMPKARKCPDGSPGLDQGWLAIHLHRLSGNGCALHLGEAAMMINGVWESPHDDRPRQAGQALPVGCRGTAGDLRPPLHLCR